MLRNCAVTVTVIKKIEQFQVPHSSSKIGNLVTFSSVPVHSYPNSDPETKIKELAGLRWWLFRRKQFESERLPPTKAAFEEAVKRTLFQCIVWNFDIVALPPIPSPELFGWKKEKNVFTPIMTSILPAPQAIIELVKCGCTEKTKCGSGRCKCKLNRLVCTELCSCGAAESSCLNRAE